MSIHFHSFPVIGLMSSRITNISNPSYSFFLHLRVCGHSYLHTNLDFDIKQMRLKAQRSDFLVVGCCIIGFLLHSQGWRSVFDVMGGLYRGSRAKTIPYGATFVRSHEGNDDISERDRKSVV